MLKKIQGSASFTLRVSRYDLYRTLHFASGGLRSRRNRPAIPSHRALPATKCKARYRRPFNCSTQDNHARRIL